MMYQVLQFVAAVYDRRSDFGDNFGDGHRPPLQGRAFRLGVLLALCLPAFGLAQNVPPAAGTPQSLPTVTLHIGKATLNTQIAATATQREIGLMYVTKLPDNDGMIFLLGDPAIATFWMKNTLIPLSVAYIDKDGVIREIYDMVPEDFSKPHVDSDLPIYRSESNQICYALETNLHWFSLNGIKPGTKIDPPPASLTKIVTP